MRRSRRRSITGEDTQQKSMGTRCTSLADDDATEPVAESLFRYDREKREVEHANHDYCSWSGGGCGI